MTTTLQNGLDFVDQHRVAVGAGLGAATIGGLGVATAAYLVSKKRAKSRKKSSSHSRSTKRSRSKKSSSKSKHHKYTSHRRIHRTKTGQPYIILASGKARFISKKSARLDRKRKGGKY
jgi:Flp pilus assembly protein TadB